MVSQIMAIGMNEDNQIQTSKCYFLDIAITEQESHCLHFSKNSNIGREVKKLYHGKEGTTVHTRLGRFSHRRVLVRLIINGISYSIG